MLFADDEQLAAVNVVKQLPSAGRGMELPSLCDVKLPKAYYDELPTHVLSNSGIGRGLQLQVIADDTTDFKRPGERLFPTNTLPELPMCSVASEEEFPRLKGAEREDFVSQKPASQLEASQISLKSLAAQFTTLKL